MSTQKIDKLVSTYKENKMFNSYTKSLLKGSYIRAVNYHETYPQDKEKFEKQLAFLGQYYTSVNMEDLDKFYKTKRWHKKKPGLIISLFEGYKNNYEVFYPLLEKYGFVGWYFVPAQFLEIDVEKQQHFADSHMIYYNKNIYNGERIAMKWDELKEIDQNQVVCSHTMSHFRFDNETSDEVLKREIIGSKELLEEKLDSKIDVFCWLGGENFKKGSKVSKYIHEAGYRYLYSNNKIEKIG
ncbi:MAG: polysaccharide deacetylase family protein [Halanaerobiales bacterium]|nr:polysaccharide deacetylase family protein [Halanaerobiales bacterium]